MKILILVIGVFILTSWKIIRLIKQELKIKYLNTDKYKCRSGIYLVTKNYDKKYITVNNLTTMYYSVLSKRVDNHLENLIKYFIYNKSELEPTLMNALFKAANIADVPLFCAGKSEEIRDRVSKYVNILYKTFELCTMYDNIVGYNYLIQHIHLKNMYFISTMYQEIHSEEGSQIFFYRFKSIKYKRQLFLKTLKVFRVLVLKY